MKKIYLIHRWEANSQADWLPWAKLEFEKLGHKVIVPDMPNTDAPVIEEWISYLESVATDTDENTYFIGHSIGCQAIMRFIEKVDKKIGGAIFVAGWFDLINLEDKESEAIAEPWIKTPLNFEKIKANISNSVAILSNNDLWVSYEKTKNDFESKLESSVVTVSNAGHITVDDGFRSFPKLIEVFKEYFDK